MTLPSTIRFLEGFMVGSCRTKRDLIFTPNSKGASAMASLLLFGVAMLISGCSTQTVVPARANTGGALASMAPTLSVERFLQAVNEADLSTMAELFGTADGPVEGDRIELERRMDLFQRILRHQDYRIVGESRVPARETPTIRLGVDFSIGGRSVPDIGFLVVQTRGGGWLIESIELDKVTGL